MSENTERDVLVYQALTQNLKQFWLNNKLEGWQKLESKATSICNLQSSNTNVLLSRLTDLINSFSSSPNFETEPRLRAITTLIENEKEKPEKAFYPIKPLALSEEIFPNPSPSNNYKESYKKLCSDFLQEVENLPNKNLKLFLSSLVYLLHKYTWCIPAINKNNKYLPFSLYDQARVSAALAACFYDFEQSKEIQTKSVVLIEGGISGIQKFIYNPAFNGQELQDGIAKRLRGRSFYINLLLKTITDYLIEELNLYNVNALWATGGHFLIVAPNTSFIKNELGQAKKKVQEWLWDEFHGALGLIITDIQIESNELKDFGKAKSELSQELAKLKHQQFLIPLNLANKDVEGRDTKDPWVLKIKDEVCRDTGQDISKEEKGISDEYQKLAHENDKNDKNDENQEDIEEDFPPRSTDSIFFDLIGRVLVRTNTLQLRRASEWNGINAIRKPKTKDDVTKEMFSSKKPLLIEFSGLNRCWLLTNKEYSAYGADLCLHIADHNNTKLDFLVGERKKDKSIVQGFEFLADAVALGANNKLQDFDELAENADGAKYLGVLRMDVDNLGFLFSEGFPSGEKSIAHIANLSRMLELFFTGYLNTLVDKDRKGNATVDKCKEDNADKGKKDNKRNLYTTYAGGDDLFIVGAWNEVVDLATDINDSFTAYSANPLLHISGGIALCKGKYPIGRAALEAGELLDSKAKKVKNEKDEVVKNALAFMEKAIIWNDLPKVLETSNKIIQGLEAKTVSRSFLYNLLALYHQYIEPEVESKKHPQTHLLMIPKFLYSLVRNITDKDLICELQTMINNQRPYLSVIAGYAALKTRKTEKSKKGEIHE